MFCNLYHKQNVHRSSKCSLDGNALFAVQILFFDSKPNINESQTGWKRLKRWKQNYLKMYIIIEIRLTIETDQAATNT